MKFVKSINRKIVLPLIYNTELFRFLGQSKRRTILCYHGIVPDPDFSINNRHMRLSQFEKDLLFFSKNCTVLPVKEMHRREAENIPPSSWEISLTFDDGFMNNYEFVKPLLEKYNFPATFYVLSGAIGNPEFVNWADLVDCVLKCTSEDEIWFNEASFSRNRQWSDHHLVSIRDYIKKMGAGRTSALSEFARRYGKSFREQIPAILWKPMTDDQVVECSKSSILTIGSHTHLHYNLGSIQEEMAKVELEQSRKMLEELIQKEVVEIAYPDGSYSPRVKDIAEQTGYNVQIAVDYRLPEDVKDKRIMKRYSVSNSTTHEGNIIRMMLNK